MLLLLFSFIAEYAVFQVIGQVPPERTKMISNIIGSAQLILIFTIAYIIINSRQFDNYFYQKKASNSGLIIILSLIFLLVFILFFSQFFYGSYQHLLNNYYCFKPGNTPFSDMRTTLRGIEAYAEGSDPLLERAIVNGNNWCYPRTWFLFSYLGVRENITNVISLVIIVLFYTLTILFIGKTNKTTAFFYGIILCSPPVVMGLERANVDILLYLLILGSVFILHTKPGRIIAPILIIVSALLKLFPVFSVLMVLREKKRTAILTFLVVSLTYVTYSVLEFHSLEIIYEQMGKPVDVASFGLFELPKYLHISFFSDLNPILLWLLAICILLMAVFLFLKNSRFLLFEVEEGIKLDAFRAGAAIYLGVFIFGYSFLYRMVFILLTLPQIIAWARLNITFGKISRYAVFLLFFLFTHLLLINHLVSVGYSFMIKEFLFWSLSIYYIYAIIYSLPRWVKVLLKRKLV